MPFSFFLEAIVKEVVVNAGDQMGSISHRSDTGCLPCTELWITGEPRRWPVSQSESGSCLDCGCKPLFGIWDSMEEHNGREGGMGAVGFDNDNVSWCIQLTISLTGLHAFLMCI